MYYSLRGTLIAADGRSAAVECGGVGYLCTVSAQTYSQLPEPGEEVLLYTHLSVREDAMELYGFATQEELNLFQQLISVSGVGPKAALSILSASTPANLALSIITGDEKALTCAQGIGKKIAQRVILELKDKLKALGGGEEVTAAAGVVNAAGNAAEAMNALTVLGYTPSDVAPVVAKFDSSLPVEELIRLTLKAMAGRM